MFASPNSLRSAAELSEYLAERGLSWAEAALPDARLFGEAFPLRIPRYYADLIDWKDAADPLRLMVIPDPREVTPQAYELGDPIGDYPHEVVPGLIHRYPDRCLLLLTSYCLVHCRFCFRREVVGKVRPVQFQKIEQYLNTQTKVQEIIFSGGDPFTFPVGFIESVIGHFEKISHIKTWRFHTRAPAIDPTSVNEEWIQALENLQRNFSKKVVIVVHINHPREVTFQFEKLMKRLQTAGFLLLSQTVLLKGINADPQTLTELFRRLIQANIKPYYLHHLDQVFGSHHFRISIAEGQALFARLRGNISGICLPEYVIDLPGGHGKVPVMWLQKTAEKTYLATTFTGEKIVYIDHAD